MKIKIVLSVIVFGGIIAILFFLKGRSLPGENQPNSNKLQVVTTFYPLEYFSEQIGGDAIQIVSLTPSGGEPHDYEPTPQDIIKIQKADVFVLNGIVEPWAQRILPQLQQENLVVIKMSDVVKLPSNADPHFWLDPVSVQMQIVALRDAFMQKDPVHAETYRHNAEIFLAQMVDLDTSYKLGLGQCEKNEIVTSHNAFAYLSNRYGFTVYSVAGFSPQQEPSPQHLAQLAEVVKAKKIQYVFTETLASSKFSDALAQEAGVKTLVLNPIEGLTASQRKQGLNYDRLMRENLQNLRLALGCHSSS